MKKLVMVMVMVIMSMATGCAHETKIAETTSAKTEVVEVSSEFSDSLLWDAIDNTIECEHLDVDRQRVEIEMGKWCDFAFVDFFNDGDYVTTRVFVFSKDVSEEM